MHEVWCYTGGIWRNITPISSELQWKSSKEELAQTVTFNIAYSDEPYFPDINLDVGDTVVIKNGVDKIKAIVINVDIDGRSPRAVTAVDYAFYLNKSQETYQFKGINAKTAITQICSDFKLPVSGICELGFAVDKIYIDKAVSDVIKDILGLGNEKYLMGFDADGFFIKKQADTTVKVQYSLADNIALVDVNKVISEPKRSRSIEDMINSVKVVLNVEDKYVFKEAEAKNQGLIDKYGLLQKVETIDKDKTYEAQAVADTKLAELGKVTEKGSITLLGNDDVRAGVLLEVYEPVTGLMGTFAVESVTHTVSSGFHKMEVYLEV